MRLQRLVHARLCIVYGDPLQISFCAYYSCICRYQDSGTPTGEGSARIGAPPPCKMFSTCALGPFCYFFSLGGEPFFHVGAFATFCPCGYNVGRFFFVIIGAFFWSCTPPTPYGCPQLG